MYLPLEVLTGPEHSQGKGKASGKPDAFQPKASAWVEKDGEWFPAPTAEEIAEAEA